MQYAGVILLLALLGSMVPDIVAPPEKSFESGQAEIQQAMDNLLTESTTSHETVEERTDHLLKEALQMLEEVQPYQKRFYLEVFAYFLQNMLNTVKLEKNHVKKSDGFPQGSPLLTSETVPDHAIPETGPQQTVQATPTVEITYPKDIPAQDEEEITTTASIPNKYENPEEKDELVRELEELHKLPAHERQRELRREIETERQRQADYRKHELQREIEGERQRQIDPQHVLSTPTPQRDLQNEIKSQHVLNTPTPEHDLEHQTESEWNHASTPTVNLIEPSNPATVVKRNRFVTDQAVRELHRLGAKQEKINEALGITRQELTGGLKLVKINQNTEINKVQSTTADDAMYKIIPNTRKPYASPYPQKPYMNDSYEARHIHLPPMNQHFLINKLEAGHHWGPYNHRMRTNPENIQNTLHKLQRENYLLKTRLMSYTQPNGNMHKIRGVTFPGPNQMRQFLPHETRYPAEFTLGQNVQNPVGTPILTPYSYITNSDTKNFTLQEEIGKTNPLDSNPLPPNINSEFSDEMKRELRDGKVILRSNSVVRSNFEPEKTRDENVKETIVVPPEVGEDGVQTPKLVAG